MQLEPVIALPRSVQERLRAAYGVASTWVPSLTSAQRVADRTNRWGTLLDHQSSGLETESVWVGAPLRVHRRCERTMFDLSNDIAYDGLMVYGTKPHPFPGPEACDTCRSADRAGCRNCAYPVSCWVDVTATDCDGKWVVAEGKALAAVLTKLHGEWGVALNRVRILSPFREVVDGCARAVRAMRLESHVPAGADPAHHRKQVETFLSDNIGTVHTMQGKEADVVILVLGTHPQRGANARAWAGESPNLLNVAVSRAKRRLFVIGNHENWRREPHFDLLAEPGRLPRHAWSTS
ncbi:ATP-binding domain-containing protein [Streptomyces sp. TRM66268-LWL]|uniref:ATP-binding domain-containing protein n=1 Tax=Streptomyces polyasparticus TaxID=2767826 RepID=A0ABR7SV87_9ACTN|nr:AAA domain-containing protein [Streptomyces polyasparticus]MBC9719421.1 ATP-binding domain-containing protein [Streptomyces polyasparticus]